MMPAALPPGPRLPSAIQTVGWWSRPIPFLERCRARYGRRFTIRLLATPPFVMLSDPEEIKQVFTSPAEVLHPGEGARILEPIVGSHSVILLDEGQHLEQRKLILGAFHGERMERLRGLMDEVARSEVEGWPRGERVSLHPRLQALTLEVILRAVFGLERGDRLESLRARLTAILAFGSNPVSMLPPLQRLLGGHGRWKRFDDLSRETDEILAGLIDERRASGVAGDDVMTMLLEARHEDGSEMSRDEIRDELMTLLVAGHETTASELAWCFDRLSHEPRVLERLVGEIDGDEGEEFLTATVQETLRRRPVLPNSAPRFVKAPIEVGGWSYPAGVCLVPNAYLVQHDPEIYPDPYSFRPERFLGQPPGTYTWIPFGGGRRRCIGANFAMLEMRIVLRTVLAANELIAAEGATEVARRRAITISPARGAEVVLERRPVVA